MKESGSRRKPGTAVRLLSFFATVLTALSMSSCIVAVPLIIVASSDKAYVQKVEVPASADKVYQEAIRWAGSCANAKILKKDDAERYVETSNEVGKASVKATPCGPEKTELVVTADAPKTSEGKETERAKEKELALSIVKNICDGLGVQCKTGD